METVSCPKYSVQACNPPVLGQTLVVSVSGLVVASWCALFLVLRGLVLCCVTINVMERCVYCGCLFLIFRQTNPWKKCQVYRQGWLLPIFLAGQAASCVCFILIRGHFAFIFVWGQGHRYPTSCIPAYQPLQLQSCHQSFNTTLSVDAWGLSQYWPLY
jgi:hypothetical protein